MAISQVKKLSLCDRWPQKNHKTQFSSLPSRIRLAISHLRFPLQYSILLHRLIFRFSSTFPTTRKYLRVLRLKQPILVSSF